MGNPLTRPDAADAPSDDLIESISRASSLLSEALAIADSNDLSPEIGARLEELIERVDTELTDRKFARAMVAAWCYPDG
jgi:hypothetical protein